MIYLCIQQNVERHRQKLIEQYISLLSKLLINNGCILLYGFNIVNTMIDIEANTLQKEQVKVVSMHDWACKQLGEKYTLLKQIGQGAYGSVYQAYRNEDNKKFAIKKMENFQQKQDKDLKFKKKQKQEKEEKQKQKQLFGFPITTLRQIKLLQHLQHDNILKINDVVFEKGHRYSHKLPVIYLCLDLMDTDLGYLVRDHQYKFTPYRIQQIAKQILQGLAYLHSKNVAHRDLKPANLLLNWEGIVKVADFGLAKKLAKFSTTLVVTMWYRAPQLFYGLKTYSTNIDIWSLGCLLAQFLIRRPLFGQCRTEKQQLEMIYDLVGTPDQCEWSEVQALQNYSIYKPSVSKQSTIIYYLKKAAPQYEQENLLLDLIEKMLRLNPHSRYSATECLQHDFFKANLQFQPLLPQSVVEKKVKLEQGEDFVGKKSKYI